MIFISLSFLSLPQFCGRTPRLSWSWCPSHLDKMSHWHSPAHIHLIVKYEIKCFNPCHDIIVFQQMIFVKCWHFIFWINMLAFGSTLKSPPRRTKSASDLFTNLTNSLICRWRYLIRFNVKIHSKMSLYPPVVVVLSTGVSYEDIDGNIRMWLHADSSHTLKWF